MAFYIDIVVGFTTSYIDTLKGDEIFSMRKIAHNYMIEGDFVIDFLSTVDVVSFVAFLTNSKVSQGMGVLRDGLSLLKVLRIRKLLQKLREVNQTTQLKAIYQIIFWTMFVYLYCHIVACVLWYNFRTDQIWLPAVDFGSFDVKVHMTWLD